MKSMKVIVYRVLTIVWMVTIFMFSAQDAEESSRMSMGIGDVVGQVFVEEYEDWSEQQRLSFVDMIELPIRKGAHALEYTLLAFLLMGASDGRKGIAALIGVLYAASDEFHQLFVPGRSGQITDVMIDSVGVILGIIIYGIYRRVICEKR